MAGSSNISWTNMTWNPVRGCERVSEGCRKCYAEILAARHSYPGGWGEGIAQFVTRPGGEKEARWTGVLKPMHQLVDEPHRWRRPRRIFVNSMSDLFHKDVPFEFIDRVFGTMAATPRHVYQILTKRPERMLEYFNAEREFCDHAHGLREEIGRQVRVIEADLKGETLEGLQGWELAGETYCPTWPLPNVWLGVSAEDQATFDERASVLCSVPAAIRFVSAEPLLGHIDARPAMPNKLWNGIPGWNEGEIQWVIVGGESGSGYRDMDIDAARQLIAHCKEAAVPIFVKQDNGARPGLQGRFTDEEWALKEYPA